ncbi:hypothetical protein ElyMa_000602000 [Elysia marginata]|uniref:Uncharacterized protein n=1 Tax=Elysia marginata TaxID=1093978 RepID=A0AAV4G8M3_9GAST|nr:hypothetical protein ElyMa_000602000 [Elysia marginata]
MFTMMSGSTSPPKLSTDKKTLSTRLVQRRLQHNEIIRKHKDMIKQQLKLKRDQQTAMLQQKTIPTVDHMSGQSTIISSTSTTVLPRPLSVQPYMCNITSSHSASILCVSTSSDKVPVSEFQAQVIRPKLHTVLSPAQTKRCQSTSLVEKHLISPYKLRESLVDQQTIKNLPKNVGESNNFWSQSQNQEQSGKQIFLISTSETTSRSPSISPITTTVVGCAARNISRLLESPAPTVVTVLHQNKRNGDDMGQEIEAFVKKRCTTSIGVAKQDSLDSKRKEDFTLVRPYSCPISFQDCPKPNKLKKKGVKSTKPSLKLRSTESHCSDKGNLQKNTEPKQNVESLKDTKSYHFVQKPQVISRPETSTITTPCSGPKSSQTHQDPTGKAGYNILNSLLSSDYNMQLTDNKLMQPQTQRLTKRDQVPHLRRISCVSENNDTNGFRSAFVPVASHKQLTNPSPSSESTQMKSESENRCFGKNEVPAQAVEPGANVESDENKGAGSEEKNGDDISLRAKLKERGFFPHFPFTTSSSSSSSSSTLCQSGDSVVSVVDSAFATPTPTAGNQKLATASAPATLSKVSSLTFPPACLASAAQSSSGCDSVTVGSPNLVPKKTIKNRFTPIRPKLDGCLNVSPQKLRASSTSASPQKRDMRPVHAILQEHRVKNAQDLLANLAHNYQAELGLQTSCNVNPANLVLSFGPPTAEGPKKKTLPGASSVNVLGSLPVQNLSLKEAALTAPSTDASIYQTQSSPAMSVSSALGESQMILLPTSSNKQGTKGVQPILVQDIRGNQYAVDKQPAGTLLLEHDMFQQSETQGADNSNLSSLKSKQAHLIGPDAQGQSYLLVPNLDQRLCQVRSKSCVPVTSVEPKVTPIHSSISLTSFLPLDINNQPSGDKSAAREIGQALMRHRTAPSAFHKCSPMGSTHKLTTDVTPLLDLEDCIAIENQKKSASDHVVASKDKLAMDNPTLNPNSDKNTLFMDQIKAGSCNSSTALLQSTISCQPKQVMSPVCPLNSVQEGSEVEKSSPSQMKNGPGMAKKGEDLIDSQSLIKVTNTCALEMPQHTIRKRKAATSDSSEHEGKKRTEEGENMENVEPSGKQESHENENVSKQKKVSSVLVPENESPLTIKPFKTSPLSDTSVNQTDTETLLSMIGDTKSMTVKEVVKALNKLRSKLKADQGNKCNLLPVSDLRLCSGPLNSAKQTTRSDVKNHASKIDTASLAHSESFAGVQEPKDPAAMSVTVPFHRPNRRNISLNLESLEIDALLDSEPNLDSQLVGDIKEQDVLKLGQQTGRRASVGTAVKAHHPFYIHDENNLPESTNSKSGESKSSKKSDSLCSPSEPNKDEYLVSFGSIKFEDRLNMKTHVSETAHSYQPSMKTERSKSCVQDILERGVSFRRDDVTQYFSSVVGLSSKIHATDNRHSSLDCRKDWIHCENDNQFRNKEANTCTQQNKTLSQADGGKTKTDMESDLPLDVIDFITESMCDDNSYHSQQLSQNPITLWLTDFANTSNSIPVTDPVREIDFDKSSASGSSAHTQIYSKLKHEGEDKIKNMSLLEVKGVDNQAYSNEENRSDHQMRAVSAAGSSGTFLSPTGPARSTRRPSMERLVSGDRNVSRTSTELPRPPSRLKTRAETPVESFCSAPSDIIVGKPSVLKRDPFSVRDHTTAVMLQQPLTSRLTSQPSAESLPDTCITNLIRQGSAELCRADRALSETPVSDPGYSSVGQTPVSEVGGSSVSPSPVMMSLDSTFRPVKSEAETTQINIDNFYRSADVNVDSNSCLTYQVLAPKVADQGLGVQTSKESEHLSISTSEANFSSEGGVSYGSQSENSSVKSNLHDTLGALSELDNLMSIRLQCIPTPPSSPSGSPQPPKETLNSCLPLVSLPRQKQSDKQNSSSPFVAPLRPPNTTPSSVTTSAMCRLNVTTNCSGLVANPDLMSSGMIPRFSPSPHLSVRPSCSPYQHYSHPSPPFTPSTQRCPTPSTFAMMSPRSATPATESSATPNRFMPIQTSGILATSMTVTQTYIQPIKPVVTLASVASKKSHRSTDYSLPDYLSTVPLSSCSTSVTSTQQLCTNSDRDYSKINHISFQPNPSVSKRHASQKALQSRSKKPIPRIPCSNLQNFDGPSNSIGNSTSSTERTGQPALVLSLGGNIGSVSLSGQGMALFDHSQQSTSESGVLPSYQEAVSNIAGSEKHQKVSSQHFPLYHTVQKGHIVQQTRHLMPSVSNSSNAGSRSTSQYTPYIVQSAARLPVQQNLVDVQESHAQASSDSETQQFMTTNVQGYTQSGNKWVIKEASNRGTEMYISTHNMTHTPDDLEETLDVLKTLDSQYFQQEGDQDSSTS